MHKKNTSFGSILKKHLDSGATQLKELAENTNYSENGIAKIRDGIADPKESTMRKIAKELGYSLSDFLSEKPHAVHTPADCWNTVEKVFKRHTRK